MLRKSILCWSLWAITVKALAVEPQASPPADEELEDLSTEPLTAREKASALEYTQKELQNKLQSAAGLDLGRVTPWSELGVSFMGRIGTQISALSLGFGDFDYSGNLNQRNYMVSSHVESAYVSTRYFLLGFGPLYLQPAMGLVHWNGDVKPRGSDDVTDVTASSLTSRFDLLGVDLDVGLGFMWIFTNGIFLDSKLMNISQALFLKESYTVSTSEARRAVRAQIAGPISMSGINVRIGYAFDF